MAESTGDLYFNPTEQHLLGLVSVNPKGPGLTRRQVQVEGWTYDKVEGGEKHWRRGREDAPWYQNGNADTQYCLWGFIT